MKRNFQGWEQGSSKTVHQVIPLCSVRVKKSYVLHPGIAPTQNKNFTQAFLEPNPPLAYASSIDMK